MTPRLIGPAWAAALAAVAIAACGGHVALGTGGGMAGSGGAPGCVLAEPPPPGPVQAPDRAGTTTFAMTRLYLGDTDPDGTPDPALGWTHYGYDIDGVQPGSPGAFCMPVDNASPAVIHPPACTGVENAFGHILLPIFLGVSAGLPAQVDQALAAGSPTILISLSGLGPGTSARPLPAQIAKGGDLMATPRYDGTDLWPVVAGTQVPLAESYLVGDTWVSGSPSTLTVTLSFPLLASSSLPLVLNLHHTVVSMKLDPTHQEATGGIISGVMSTADLVQQLEMLVIEVSPACCSVDCESIASEIEQASDILVDGTQDPTKACDGVSVGLGFDAARVQLGPAVPPPDAGPPPDPCAMDGG
jgi:hypothetical protein